MRNLILILDQIVHIAPELASYLSSIRESTKYSAPEMLPSRWRETAFILNKYASDHLEKDKIAAIFNGEKK